MLTKPDPISSLAFTTTLMLSGLREGSQRFKAYKQKIQEEAETKQLSLLGLHKLNLVVIIFRLTAGRLSRLINVHCGQNVLDDIFSHCWSAWFKDTELFFLCNVRVYQKKQNKTRIIAQIIKDLTNSVLS